MRTFRAAAIALFAFSLTACGSGTSPGDDVAPTRKPVTLSDVRDECVKKTGETLKDYTDKLTADQFFELTADGKTLRIHTPAPIQDLTRALALFASQCAFREAGAADTLVERMTIPADGPQNGAWKGYSGTWESSIEEGYQASVTAVP